MILVWFMDLTFLCERAATPVGTSNPPHEGERYSGQRGRYIITFVTSWIAGYRVCAMSIDHHAHIESRHIEPVSAAASILRLSVWQRLSAVMMMIAVLWATVYWAMH